MDDSAYSRTFIQYCAVQCSAVHAKFYLCLSIDVSLNNSYSSMLNVMIEQSNFMTSMKLCEPQKCNKCPDVRLILSRLHPLVSFGTLCML